MNAVLIIHEGASQINKPKENNLFELVKHISHVKFFSVNLSSVSYLHDLVLREVVPFS